MLAGQSESESPINESQEKEVDADEIFVRRSKPRKFLFCVVRKDSVATPPKCCYQHISFLQGHQLENGLVAPLLC